ncbi:GIY-YIG nuclease family protein [Paraglaciecola aquimarina]|uniref:GIY-YIG nuclease family protein n=1 Tax=Paraglaciecola algarum TaxID=3050085 RepID=A0ABS9D585_9ALTE|nr:GIY-YIG nuclease family protein [Paraglaciecola sp. G1-23]
MTRRFAEHQSNGPKCAKALKGKGPLTLKFFSQVDDHSHALKTEIWIKKQSKSNKVKLVEGQLSDTSLKNMLHLQEVK